MVVKRGVVYQACVLSVLLCGSEERSGVSGLCIVSAVVGLSVGYH